MMIKGRWSRAQQEGAVKIIHAPLLLRLSESAVRFLLGAVLSGVELPGGYPPFGVAFVGASGPGADGACALLGTLFGSLCLRGFSRGLQEMAAAVLIFSVAFAFYDAKAYRRPWFMPLVSAAATAVTGLAGLAGKKVGMAGAVGFFSAVCLTGASVYFDRIALSARVLAEGEGLSDRQKTALLLFGATLLMALARITVMDGLSVGRILAAVAVLWAAAQGGTGVGAALGISAGLAMDLAGGEGVYVAAFGFSGLLAGVFREQGRLFSTLAFVLANGMMALWMWDRWTDCMGVLYEVFVASVVFTTLPDRVFRCAELSRRRSGEEYWDRRRLYVKEKLEHTAKAFRVVYENLRESFAPDRREGEEAPFRIFDRAAEQVCIRCALRERCWQIDYQTTKGALNDGLGAMLERGKAVPGDLPVWFTSRCIRLEAFLEAVNEGLTALIYQKRYQTRLRESRAAVCRQYGELSRALEDAALELSRELTVEPVRERRLGRWLAGHEVDGEWSVFYDEHGHLRAEIVTRESEKLANEESRVELSKLFAMELRPARVESKRGKSRVIYTQAEPLAAAAGVAAKKKDGECVSGDSGSWFKGEDGVLWLLLCDGMGSGPRANRESELAIRLLETFLRAGMAPEDALRTLNAALALRGEEEGGFTTVDLCRVDLFTGAGSVYKFGAAPTYIKKRDTVIRITGGALPAGLTVGERMEADVTPFHLEVGDLLVLLTDGITDGEEDRWLRETLQNFDGASPKDLARSLLEQGTDAAAAPDDRTVLVVQIGKR